jgi:ssRNA-specific RNase YbeY (16S rRNA maturation enzyme)
MMIHGLVHLKGFDHERNDSAWLVMSGLEKLLQKELIQQMGKPKWTTLR